MSRFVAPGKRIICSDSQALNLCVFTIILVFWNLLGDWKSFSKEVWVPEYLVILRNENENWLVPNESLTSLNWSQASYWRVYVRFSGVERLAGLTVMHKFYGLSNSLKCWFGASPESLVSYWGDYQEPLSPALGFETFLDFVFWEISLQNARSCQIFSSRVTEVETPFNV